MTSKSQSTERSTKASNPEGYAAAITSLARVQRSLRDMGDSNTRYGIVTTADPIARRGTVSGPLTAEQAKHDDDMRAEIARQDANPQDYILPPYTPKQLSETFNVPLEMCQGLGTEA
jgi:hypothetical protein